MENLCDKFDSVTACRKMSTIKCYQSCLYRLKGNIGNISIQEISQQLLEKTIVEICSKYSIATQNRIKSAYRSFFKWAFQSKLIFENPAEGIGLARPNSKQTKPISRNEVFQLLDSIVKSHDSLSVRDSALFATYAFTGIRRSSALLLTINDYDKKKDY